jgi:hypothetical protein
MPDSSAFRTAIAMACVHHVFNEKGKGESEKEDPGVVNSVETHQ